jgi:hypothetical protein
MLYVVAIIPLGPGRKKLKKWEETDYKSEYLRRVDGGWMNCYDWYDASVFDNRRDAQQLMGEYLDGICLPCFAESFDIEVVVIPDYEITPTQRALARRTQ